MVRLFGSKGESPMAQQGLGNGGFLLTFARGDDHKIPVVGLMHHADAVQKLVGNRPRGDIEREKNVSLRLVREFDNPHDSNAIAVVSDAAGHIGYVPRHTAQELAPGIDNALRDVAKIKRAAGATVDVYASAFLYAEWSDLEDLEPGDDRNVADSVQIELGFIESWGVVLSPRK